MAASLAPPRGLLTFVFICCIFAGARGNLLRLFASNPPAFVNVSDLKSNIRTLVDNVGNRLRCEEHGSEHAECVKCLDTDNIISLLQLDPTSRTFTRVQAEDLSVFLVHQLLYFESTCISQSGPGCSSVRECQDEVLGQMARYVSPPESLVKVLRIFKLYLKEEEQDRECFSAQDILEELPQKNLPRDEVEGLRQAFSIIMGHIFQGRCIGIGESVTDFLDDIFHHYGDNCSPYMSLGGLKRLMYDMQTGKGDEHDHDHQHSHHHDNSHDDGHDCNHKHAHFAHFHDGHYHSPHHHDHNSSHGHFHHHPHDHSSHDDFDHDHSDHDHDHSEYDHYHPIHNHSGQGVSGHLHSAEQIDVQQNLTQGVDHSNQSPKFSGSRLQSGDQLDSKLNPNEEVESPPSYGVYTERGTEIKITEIEYTDESIEQTSTPVVPSNFTASKLMETVGEGYSTTSPPLPRTLNMDTSTQTSTIPSSSPTPPSNNINRPLNSFTPRGPGDNLVEASVDGNDRNATRIRRSTSDQTEFNGPSASLRSDLSHPEEEKIEEPSSSDDVKKVYLLQNDQNRNTNLELSGTPHQFASLAAKCLSPEQLIAKFGLRENDTLSKGDFIQLCPALIQQVVTGVCTESALPPLPLPSRMEVYGYGSLSVFIITLTSLAGVLLLPIMTKMAYNYIIAGFYGLAFSTLAADAMLHLMPQFLGLHSHGGGGHSHEGVFLEPYAQLQLGVFFTIYALFLFEATMGAFAGGDQHVVPQENKGHGHSHGHFPDELPTLISVKTKSEIQLNVSRDQSNTSLDTEIVDLESIKKPPNLMVAKPVFLGLTSMAIVVTLGDSMHNFGDGLAIGAAFSTGIRGGLSTAIAVFCHEVPHEFGDFVVLLSTGLSFSKALWINFLSGLTCFGGLYIGILIGDNEVARKWVMAVTAGIFLYVALGEMLPELREHTQGSRLVMLLIKNLGILAGLGIMLLISLYEDQIA